MKKDYRPLYVKYDWLSSPLPAGVRHLRLHPEEDQAGGEQPGRGRTQG